MKALFNAALALLVVVTGLTGGLLTLYSALRVPFPFALLLTTAGFACLILVAVGLRLSRRVRRFTRRRTTLPLAVAVRPSARTRPLIQMALVNFD